MLTRTCAVAVLICLAVSAAEVPLPELRTEATDGGSVFRVRNTGAQPLTAFLIELVNYPGSSYALWQDEIAGVPVAPGQEKRIPVSNMTVGAAPEYVKLQAAIYADGATSGVPEKVTQLIERRRFTLQTTREAIARIEKAQASSMTKEALAGDLRQWAESMPAPSRANRNTQAAINYAAGRALIMGAASRVQSESAETALTVLRASERALAASKPPL